MTRSLQQKAQAPTILLVGLPHEWQVTFDVSHLCVKADIPKNLYLNHVPLLCSQKPLYQVNADIGRAIC